MPDDEKAEKAVTIPISVSPVLYEYLGYLARHTPLGFKETDVARYLLTQRLEAMVAEKYHEKLVPPKDKANAATAPKKPQAGK